LGKTPDDYFSNLMHPCPGYNHDHLAAPLGLPFRPHNADGSVRMLAMAIRAVAMVPGVSGGPDSGARRC
jgi:hypothetical protein